MAETAAVSPRLPSRGTPQPRGHPVETPARLRRGPAEALAAGNLQFLGGVLTHSHRLGHIPTEVEVRSAGDALGVASWPPFRGQALRRGTSGNASYRT